MCTKIELELVFILINKTKPKIVITILNYKGKKTKFAGKKL